MPANRPSLAILVASLIGLAPTARAEELKLTCPGAEWQKLKPERAGISSKNLDALRVWLKTQKTSALHVSVKGRAIFEYGDLKRVSKVASVRKSILAMLYGNYCAAGKIDLHATVEQVGLTDVQPFLPMEKNATLYNLLTARSGIYHPSGNDELTSLSPRRGAQPPGTYFQYQNWDFNAAGTALQKLTGKDIFDALESDLARPTGMQGFDRSRQRKISSMPDSVHPEYAMYLSTRDMARIGLLMLADGNWNGKQVLPRALVPSAEVQSRITRPLAIRRDLSPDRRRPKSEATIRPCGSGRAVAMRCLIPVTGLSGRHVGCAPPITPKSDLPSTVIACFGRDSDVSSTAGRCGCQPRLSVVAVMDHAVRELV